MSLFRRFYSYRSNFLLRPAFQRNFGHVTNGQFMEGEPGPVQVIIERKLKEKFDPLHLQVINESYKHSVPKGSESHFKIVIVSKAFEGEQLIQRHRSVNNVLSTELQESIHALSIQAKTPDQWEASDHSVHNTPACLGGSKADRQK